MFKILHNEFLLRVRKPNFVIVLELFSEQLFCKLNSHFLRFSFLGKKVLELIPKSPKVKQIFCYHKVQPENNY
jgi:hypothetical protein